MSVYIMHEQEFYFIMKIFFFSGRLIGYFGSRSLLLEENLLFADYIGNTMSFLEYPQIFYSKTLFTENNNFLRKAYVFTCHK